MLQEEQMQFKLEHTYTIFWVKLYQESSPFETQFANFRPRKGVYFRMSLEHMNTRM